MSTSKTQLQGLPAYPSRQQSLSLISTLFWYLLSSIGLAPPKPTPVPTPVVVTAETTAADVEILPVPQAPPLIPRQAQVPTLLPTDQQGNQLVLNGRSLPLAWSVRQGRIGIADAALMQAFGVSLLTNRSLSQQPIQWFSDATTNPLLLNTWLSNSFRYLDTTLLAQRFGWQVRVEGNQLQVTTPPAQILGIRQGRQNWGDRIVLDLDRPLPWQVNETTQEWTITLDGRIDPALIQNFVAMPGNRLTNLGITSNATQTTIRIGVSGNLRPRIFTLVNPNRLVIDVRPDFLVERDIAWAPGVRWRQRYVNLGNHRFPITLLEVDPRQPGLSLQPIWSNPGSSIGTAPLITTAQRWQAAAAINGGFFNRENQLPLGAIRQNNQWISGPILNRGAIAWGGDSQFLVGNLSVQEVVIAAGQQFPIRHFNSGFVATGISRYDPQWGATYTPLSNNEQILSVQTTSTRPGSPEQIVSQEAGGAAGQTAFPIPANGYLLVVRADPNAAIALSPGTEVQRQFSTTPSEFNRYPHIIGAGPLLIQNRQIVLNPQAEQFSPNFITQAAARSAIGQTAAGTLMLVTVQHRQDGPGPTLTEIAQIMQVLGATNALNLDGGSSTALYLGGQLLNRSPRTAARVHNGIGVFFQSNPQ